jgi:tRNA G18 (ribose-2'-O)-methylase SpoU
MQIVPVADFEDQRLASFRAMRDRDAQREGLFIAEGKVVLDVLFKAGRFEAQSLLLLDRRLDGLRATLAAAPAGLPVYVAPQDVLDRVAGFHLHRGVLAAVRRRPQEDAAGLLASLPATATVVAAVGIANHDNVGAIFRNAAAFGADAVLLDATSCDPLYRKAIRVSVGAALKIPFAIVPDAATLPALLASHGFEALALSPSGERDIAGIRRAARTALVLGAEGPGLPAALMGGMTTVRIAMAPGFDSLNVAAASAVALHRLFKG